MVGETKKPFPPEILPGCKGLLHTVPPELLTHWLCRLNILLFKRGGTDICRISEALSADLLKEKCAFLCTEAKETTCPHRPEKDIVKNSRKTVDFSLQMMYNKVNIIHINVHIFPSIFILTHAVGFVKSFFQIPSFTSDFSQISLCGSCRVSPEKAKGKGLVCQTT